MRIYRSNLRCPDLRPCFPHAREFHVRYDHVYLHDKDFDVNCGYITHDDAAILWNTAQQFPGLWAEVGSHTGWSGSHIVRTGTFLVAIEPQFRRIPFYLRARENFKRAEAWDYVLPFAGLSADYFVCGDPERFDGAFIDGDHEPGMPLADARMILSRLKDRAVVVFHDFCGAPVREAVRYLAQGGFKWRAYNTPQMMAVCWRGDFTPPDHVPDPAVDWVRERNSHTDFDYADES